MNLSSYYIIDEVFSVLREAATANPSFMERAVCIADAIRACSDDITVIQPIDRFDFKHCSDTVPVIFRRCRAGFGQRFGIKPDGNPLDSLSLWRCMLQAALDVEVKEANDDFEHTPFKFVNSQTSEACSPLEHGVFVSYFHMLQFVIANGTSTAPCTTCAGASQAAWTTHMHRGLRAIFHIAPSPQFPPPRRQHVHVRRQRRRMDCQHWV